jgi:hypothetical protein
MLLELDSFILPWELSFKAGNSEPQKACWDREGFYADSINTLTLIPWSLTH